MLEFPVMCFINLYYSSACFPDTLDRTKVQGKILVCLREDTLALPYGKFAAIVGAAGVILANSENMGYEISSEPHIITASMVNFVDADSIFAYMKSTKYISSSS